MSIETYPQSGEVFVINANWFIFLIRCLLQVPQAHLCLQLAEEEDIRQ